MLYADIQSYLHMLSVNVLLLTHDVVASCTAISADGDGDFDITDFYITEFAITIFQEIDITESDITKKRK